MEVCKYDDAIRTIATELKFAEWPEEGFEETPESDELIRVLSLLFPNVGLNKIHADLSDEVDIIRSRPDEYAEQDEAIQHINEQEALRDLD
ncbi:hypothetical protein GJ698_02170 [Pseudoduganella sp. FT26W]|uniref:Uncharacterized protein n=1 Tax=Duganella aquatilis TaxID=2666082 RepID=A0A844CZF5_9BURK|nr:hypothetical protein [Duganella aquatilis]MRW82895.1 hypothetical protein [Duganella aquatilis]